MTRTKNEIHCTNIIWIGYISKLGGVESFAFYMAKKYQNYDIMVLCRKRRFETAFKNPRVLSSRGMAWRKNILQTNNY